MNAPAKVSRVDTVVDRLQAAREHLCAAMVMAADRDAEVLVSHLDALQKQVAALLPVEYLERHDTEKLQRIRGNA